MSGKVKIALGQMAAKLGDVEYNVAKAKRFVAQAAEDGADIICLPELFATGYNMALLQQKMVSLSRTYYDYILEEISQSAGKHQIYVIAPVGVPKGSNEVYNGALLFDRNGSCAGRYYKTHAFSLEKEYFAEGNNYQVFATDFGKIGILICYDIGFPEAARNLCLQGAEIIFVPAAWREQDQFAWELNIPSRALENQLFTVGVNRCGTEGDLRFFGRSMICSPMGKVYIQVDCVTEGPVTYQIDLAEIAESRNHIGYLRDRKPEIY